MANQISIVRRSGALLCGVIWICILADPRVGSAHAQSVTYVDLTVSGSQLEATFSFQVSDLSLHFALDRNADQKVDAGELAAGCRTVSNYVLQHTRLSSESERIELVPRPLSLERSSDDQLVQIRFSSRLAHPLSQLGADIDFADRFGGEHAVLVKVSAGKEVQQAVLVHEEPSYSFQLQGVPPRYEPWRFLKLGVEHIFLGYDHILFLMALLVAGSSFKQLLKIVTAFSVAHSLTLALAALEIVTLPPRLVEAAIAASIVYVAAENFWMPRGRDRWILTFFFGLIHGFGFANVLREMQLPVRGLALSLLSFNLGVELGQILILILLFPFVLWLARRQFQGVGLQLVSSLVLLFGLGWLTERTFGLQFMPF